MTIYNQSKTYYSRLLVLSFVVLFVASYASLAHADNTAAPVTATAPVTLTVTPAAPNRVGDLSVPFYQANSVSLSWQVDSPKYDDNAVYDIRYSTSPITDDNFATATQYTGAVIPSSSLSLVNGTNRVEVISGLTQNTTYHFALKAKFAGSGWSLLSDIPSFSIPANTQNTSTALTSDLSYGTKSPDVAVLQKFLAGQGFFFGPITQYFGSVTKAAVVAFQGKNNLPTTGYVGAMTRKVILGMTAAVAPTK